MREGTRRCTVGRPAEEVWELLSDYRNVVGLAASEFEVALDAGAPGVEGSRYSGSLSWEGLRSEFRTSLKESSRPNLLMWSGSGPGATASIRFEITDAEPGRSRVAATYALSLSKTTRPLEPFGWALVERMTDRMMRRLHNFEGPVA